MKKSYALCRHLGSSASAGLPWLPPAEALTPDYDLSEVPPCSVAYENPQTPFLFFYVQRRLIELLWGQNAEPETDLRLFQPAISDTLHSFFIRINSPSSSKTWYVIMRQHCPNRKQDSLGDRRNAHGGLKIATCNILASNVSASNQRLLVLEEHLYCENLGRREKGGDRHLRLLLRCLEIGMWQWRWRAEMAAGYATGTAMPEVTANNMWSKLFLLLWLDLLWFLQKILKSPQYL